MSNTDISAVLSAVQVDCIPTGIPVRITTSLSPGPASFTVRCSRAASDLAEARDRVRAAILNSGLEWPSHHQVQVTIDTSARRFLESSGLDLAMAVSILAAAGEVRPVPSYYRLLARLGPDGHLRSVVPAGFLVSCAFGARGGVAMVAPADTTAVISNRHGVTVVACRDLCCVASWLRGER